MKSTIHFSPMRSGAVPVVMAALCVLLLALPAQAQDVAISENEFEAQRAAAAVAAAAAESAVQDPLAALTSPPPEGEDTLITNQSQESAVVPQAQAPQAQAPEAQAQAVPELSPVEDAATAEPPAMPAAVAQPAAETVVADPAPAAVAPPDTPAASQDPLAPFRAQQAIIEAEQRRATQGGGAGNNPLGPAAQLPLSNRPMQSPEDMQAQLEAEAAMQQERMQKQIFDASLESLLPLTPEQTRSVLDSFRVSREAAELPIAVPRARTTVENVSLDPSQPPLSIKTSPGYVTTLTILDMTGAPWAIQDISWAGKFEVTTPEEGGHVIRITPMSAHGVGNISIRLVDLITPVTFSIDTGLDVVDYRFDARIPKPGPLAKTPLIAHGGLSTVAGTDENLMRVLDGTAVGAARRLTLDGVDGATTAYSINETMYLRTPLTLLSPSWHSSASSADGMNVYTLKATPVILLSDKGRMIKARLKAAE